MYNSRFIVCILVEKTFFFLLLPFTAFLFFAPDATLVVLFKTDSSGAFNLLSLTPGCAALTRGYYYFTRWGNCSCFIFCHNEIWSYVAFLEAGILHSVFFILHSLFSFTQSPHLSSYSPYSTTQLLNSSFFLFALILLPKIIISLISGYE